LCIFIAKQKKLHYSKKKRIEKEVGKVVKQYFLKAADPLSPLIKKNIGRLNHFLFLHVLSKKKNWKMLKIND